MEPNRDENVIIVGAGPAGLRAAEVLAGVKLRPVLIDAETAPGGRPGRLGRLGQARLGDRDASLRRAFAGLAKNLDYRPETVATGVSDGHLEVRRGSEVARLPFDALILATGASEVLLPFTGWSRTGVVGSSRALAELSRGRAVGRRPVFVGTGPMLYRAAARHAANGVAPAAVLDTGAKGGILRAAHHLATDWMVFADLLGDLAALQLRRVALRRGVRPLAAVGNDVIEALHCRDAAGEEFAVPCDAIVTGFGWQPDDRLATLAGARFAPREDDGGWRAVLEDTGGVAGKPVYLAGGARGQGAIVPVAEASGTIAAFAALIDLGYPVTVGTLRFWMTRIETRRLLNKGLAKAFPLPLDIALSATNDTLVCPCGDITVGRLRALAGEGVADLNGVWNATGLGCGECGGLHCAAAAGPIFAAARGTTSMDVGRLASPTPISPENLGGH